jgi:hypothetical protein
MSVVDAATRGAILFAREARRRAAKATRNLNVCSYAQRSYQLRRVALIVDAANNAVCLLSRSSVNYLPVCCFSIQQYYGRLDVQQMKTVRFYSDRIGAAPGSCRVQLIAQPNAGMSESKNIVVLSP